MRHQPAFQSRLYQTSYCWDVRDVVDIREIRKGWRRCGFQLLDLLFPWQQEPHRGGFFLHRLEKPFSNRRNIQSGSGRAGLTAVCARCCSCVCVCLSFIFMFLFCTHRLKNDTTENTSEGNHNLCVTVYIQREIWDLMVLILVVFQGNPLLPPNHRSVSLETKRWHVETMECFCCKKKNTSATGKVQLQVQRLETPSVINSTCSFPRFTEGEHSGTGEVKETQRKDWVKDLHDLGNSTETFSKQSWVF